MSKTLSQISNDTKKQKVFVFLTLENSKMLTLRLTEKCYLIWRVLNFSQQMLIYVDCML